MSLEKLDENECSCPCGNGRIYRERYPDNQGESKAILPTIECSKCKTKYHIESFSSDGKTFDIYYCVQNDYPPYERYINPKAYFEGRFEPEEFIRTYNIYEMDIEQYFVENYSKNLLIQVMSVLENYSTYNKIPDNGIGSKARELVRRYKGWYNTQRMSTVIQSIKKSIENYSDYEFQFDKRKKIPVGYNSYLDEKKQASLLLNL